MQPIAIHTSSKRNLAQKLSQKGEVLRFEEDPIVASLCTCLALQFEMGNEKFDRLSGFLGVDPPSAWESEIFVSNGEVGIRFWRQDGKPLQPLHTDLRFLLDPSSIDENGNLSRAVIFPSRVARHYAKLGFQLVIVRDWILNSALSAGEATVAYLHTNEWEVRNRIAVMQAELMVRREIPFFGTHDIVDHLFALDASGYSKLRPLHQQAATTFSRVFDCAQQDTKGSRPHLLAAYLVGVALDDLAQPRWYGSPSHAFVVDTLLAELERLRPACGSFQVPLSFHELAAEMRQAEFCRPDLERAIGRFVEAIQN
jgi:hypothetical protein